MGPHGAQLVDKDTGKLHWIPEAPLWHALPHASAGLSSHRLEMTFTCALPRRNFSNQYDGMKPLTDFPALLLDSVPIHAEILCRQIMNGIFN